MTNQPHTHVIRALSAWLAVAVLVGFVVLAAVGMADSFSERNDPRLDAELVHLMTGITALVGGVVAAAFGAQTTTSASEALTPTIFGEDTSHVLERTGRMIGSAYAVTYVLVGTSAVVVWIVRQEKTVAHVEALASTFLGLALIIVAAFFRQPAPRQDAAVPVPRTPSLRS
jgi:hypothetical protein